MERRIPRHLQRVIAQSRFDGLTGTHYAQLAGRDEPIQLQWRHTTSGATKEWYEARCQRSTSCLTTSLGEISYSGGILHQTETNEVAISIVIGERKRLPTYIGIQSHPDNAIVCHINDIVLIIIYFSRGGRAYNIHSVHSKN